MINSVYNIFDKFKSSRKKYKWNKIKKTTFANNFVDFPNFIFKENEVLIEEDKPSEKIAIVKEELDGIDIDDVGNLEDLLKIVFIYEERDRDVRELTRNNNKEKKSFILQAFRCLLSEKCFRQKYFFNKHLEYCEIPLETHEIHLPFSCKRWTLTKIIRLDLSGKLRLYRNI